MSGKLKITYLSIDVIIPYINNSRVHSKEQIEQIKSSIIEFGMCTPIGIHNNTIVYGHGRYEALKQLGYKEVPTLDLSHLSDYQRKAYTIADNKIGDNSIFDKEMLKIELSGLEDFDLEIIGFDDEEIINLELEGFDEIDGELFDEDLFEDDAEPSSQDKIKLGVICDNDTDKQQLKEELLSRGYLCQ